MQLLRRSPTRAAFVACSVLFAGACADSALRPEPPDIRVCRDSLDVACGSPIALGAFRAGDTHTTAIVIRNAGGGTLEIDNVEVIDGPAAVRAFPNAVEPGFEDAVELTVTPILGSNSAHLAFDSNDPDTPRLEVELTFQGVGGSLVLCPTSGLDSTPADCAENLTVRLHEARLNRAEEATVVVRNAGAEPMTLADATFSFDTSVADELAVVSPTDGGTLAAGAERPLVLRHIPRDADADEMVVMLSSVDMDPPERAVLRVQTGAPDNQAPVADAREVDTGLTATSIRVGLGVWLDGRGSSDPEGNPLAFSWSMLSAPPASGATVETPSAKLTRFEPDVLGDYRVQLEVRDAWGATSAAEVTVTATPRFDLTVRASWGPAAGDVDLHLLPEGAVLFGAEDCFFNQTTVDWGSAGDASDDPELLADDVTDAGTERIRIERPAPGRYDVFLHYFDDGGGNTASIDLEIAGDDETAPIATVTGQLQTRCELWHAGTVDWPARVFTPAAGASPAPTCYPGGTP